MDNGMSERAEGEVRRAAATLAEAVGRLKDELDQPAWDFQVIEAAFSVMSGNAQYIAGCIQRGMIILMREGKFERIMGVPLPPEVLGESVPNVFNFDIEAMLRRIRENGG